MSEEAVTALDAFEIFQIAVRVVLVLGALWVVGLLVERVLFDL
jgi:hypothetical protein